MEKSINAKPQKNKNSTMDEPGFECPEGAAIRMLPY